MSAIRKLIYHVYQADLNGNLSEGIDGNLYTEAFKEMSEALNDVLEERKRQDTKWGEQNHNPYIYYAIVGEEFGELAEAILQTQFGGGKGGFENIRKEAIHMAATSLALIECLDRGKYPKLLQIEEISEDRA